MNVGESRDVGEFSYGKLTFVLEGFDDDRPKGTFYPLTPCCLSRTVTLTDDNMREYVTCVRCIRVVDAFYSKHFTLDYLEHGWSTQLSALWFDGKSLQFMSMRKKVYELVYDFVPVYSKWRHGGWYVTNVCYPSGAVGCVSRNYPDKKWRIVCGDHGVTYATRDDAARAEWELSKEDACSIATTE